MDFTRKNYKWTLGGLSKCIEDNKLESQIVAYTDTAAIVHVKNYHDSQILGAESDWCISQHKSSWEQYVSKNKRIQLFFYNFSKFVKDNMDLVGATFVADKKNVSLFC